MTPYIGSAYSYVSGYETISILNDNTIESENTFIPVFTSKSEIDMSDNIGYFMGITAKLSKYGILSVEKRMKDENSFGIGITFKI